MEQQSGADYFFLSDGQPEELAAAQQSDMRQVLGSVRAVVLWILYELFSGVWPLRTTLFTANVKKKTL